jgi:hypothetical protein
MGEKNTHAPMERVIGKLESMISFFPDDRAHYVSPVQAAVQTKFYEALYRSDK